MESNPKAAGSKAKRKNMKPKKSGFIIKLLLVAIIFCVAAVSVVGFISFNESQKMKNAVNIDTIYENIFINDVNVGKLTKEEALEKLSEAPVSEIEEKIILLKCAGKEKEVSYKGLGVTYDYTRAVDEAYQYAREGTLKERYKKIVALQKEPKVITYEPEYTKIDVDVKNQIVEFTEDMYVAPTNATLSRQNGSFNITPEAGGQKADVDEALARVEELIKNNEGGVVEIAIVEVPPTVTAADFEKATTMIGAAETNFSGAVSDPRNQNLANALSKINDYVVFPGEVFSTNAAFGEMTAGNGYRMAKVIENGEFVDGMGGGVCQVSTTLYQALLEAELEIVERRNHSLKVGYADYGFDATLAGTYIDLKFKNDTNSPVFIEAFLDSGSSKVRVRIYGSEIHSSSRRLVFNSALVDTLHPTAELVVEDPALPLNAKLVVATPKTGYKYRLYKTVYEGGQQIEHVLVNESTYRSVRGEVRIGTGESVEYDADGNPVLPDGVAGKLTLAEPDPEAEPSASPGPEPDLEAFAGQREQTPSDTPVFDTPRQEPPTSETPQPDPELTQPDEPILYDEGPLMPDL